MKIIGRMPLGEVGRAGRPAEVGELINQSELDELLSGRLSPVEQLELERLRRLVLARLKARRAAEMSLNPFGQAEVNGLLGID